MKPELISLLKKQTDFELGRRERAEPPADFPALPEMPAARYIDPRLYELEQQYIFAKQWLYVGESSQLPEIGSYLLWEQAGPPVLLVRGKDQIIRAFYNSCSHRGASLVRDGCGKAKGFACNFHCWTYDLEGALKTVPDQHEFPNLDKSAHGLKPLRCEMFGNLIFVNRDMNAMPLIEHLGKAGREIAHHDFEKRHYIKSMHFDLECNWKVAIDAFAESYHLFRTHANTVNPVFQSHGLVLKLWPRGHSFMLTPARRDNRADWIMDVSSQDPRHELSRTEQLSVTLFPNIIIPLAEFMMPIFNFWPTGINKTHFEAVITTPCDVNDEESANADVLLQQLSVIVQEDVSNMAAIQKSVESGTLQSIPLGCQERRIYQFHEEIDRQIGIDRIPPELRMKPICEPYIET